MKKVILTLLCFTYFALSFGQLKFETFKDTTSRTEFPTDTSINNVLNKSNVSILFRNYSAWSIWKEYKLISYQSDNEWHYNVLIHPDTSYLFFEIKAPQDSILKLWNTIESNKLFSITKENLYDSTCDAIIHDSHYYEFWIVIKNQYRKIRYYNPEYFERECKSSPDRKLIIKTAKIFLEFIKKYK